MNEVIILLNNILLLDRIPFFFFTCLYALIVFFAFHLEGRKFIWKPNITSGDMCSDLSEQELHLVMFRLIWLSVRTGQKQKSSWKPVQGNAFNVPINIFRLSGSLKPTRTLRKKRWAIIKVDINSCCKERKTAAEINRKYLKQNRSIYIRKEEMRRR